MRQGWILGLFGLGIAGTGWTDPDPTQIDFGPFRFQRAEEYVQRASVFNGGGNLTTVNKHLLNLVFLANYAADPPPPPDHGAYTTHAYDFWIDAPTEAGFTPTPSMDQAGVIHIPTQPMQEFEIHLVAPDYTYMISGGNVYSTKLRGQRYIRGTAVPSGMISVGGPRNTTQPTA